MNYRRILLSALLCLVPFCLIPAAALPQDPSDKAKPTEAPKNEDKKKKTTADSTITVVFRISAEGMTSIPSGSVMQVNGDEEICKKLKRDQHLEPDGVTSITLPLCKVKLNIYISGIDSKTVSVDLGKYKEPIKILVKLKGEPTVSP